MRLDSKVAYVTGAGQGIGRAFAHALGEAGAKVAVVDLVQAKAEAVAEELFLKGKECLQKSKPDLHAFVLCTAFLIFEKTLIKWCVAHLVGH